MATAKNEHAPLERVVVGHPVDVVTGNVYTAWTDLLIRGYVPIRWRRFYTTGSQQFGPLGIGWTVAWLMSLTYVDGNFVLTDEENRSVVFTQLSEKDGKRIQAAAQMELSWRAGHPVIYNWHDHLIYVFNEDPLQDNFRLAAVENLPGDSVNLIYNSSEQLIALQESAGRTIQIHYDDLDRISALSFSSPGIPLSPIVQYRYDADNRLTRVVSPGGAEIRYAYDSFGRLSAEQNASGGLFYFQYDSFGRCVHTWGDGGYLERKLEYLPDKRCTKVIDSRGNLTTFFYTATGSITRIVDAAGAETRKLSTANFTQEIDPLGAVRWRERDDDGNIIRFGDWGGGVTSYKWNALRMCVAETDAEGHSWKYKFDEDGRATGAEDGSGGKWKLKANQHGRIEQVEDPNGGLTRFVYDAFGYRKKKIDAEGGITTYQYDAWGSLTSMRDRYGRTFDYEYDESRRLVQVNLAGKRLYSWKYDEAGHIISYRDASGRGYTAQYSVWGQTLRVQSPLPEYGLEGDFAPYSQWNYDTEGNVVEFLDPGGRGCRNEYDSLNRFWRKHFTDGGFEEYAYDTAGNVIRKVLDGAEPITYEYGIAHRVTTKFVPNSGATKFEYNLLGQLIKAENQNSTIEFKRNAFGQVVSDSQNGKTVSYKYNSFGKRVEMSTPTGVTVRYEYDKIRRLTGVIGPSPEKFTYATEHPTRERRETGNGLIEYRRYSPETGSLKQSLVHSKGGMPPVWERTFQFGPSGRVKMCSELDGSSRAFQYDSWNRLHLTLSNHRHRKQFNFDVSDNISSAGDCQRYYDGRNRLIQSGSDIYEYNDASRTLRIVREDKRSTLYEFDAEGLLRRATLPNQSCVTFEYDPLGRRTKKTTSDRTVSFLWDLDNLLLEENASLGRSDLYVFEPDTFRPLSRLGRNLELDDDAFTTHYYHHDLLGTARELTDSKGNLVWQGRYEEFGRCEIRAGDRALNPFRFPGQYYDTETELHYSRFRYYDPRLARFLTQDPLGFNGGNNLFSYPPDPVNHMDPLGLDCGDPNRVHIYHGTLDEDALRESGFTTKDKYGGEASPPYVCVSTDPAAARDAINPGTRYDAQGAPAPAVLSGSMSQQEWDALHANGDLSNNNYNGFGNSLGGTQETKARTPAGVAALNRAFGLPGGQPP